MLQQQKIPSYDLTASRLNCGMSLGAFDCGDEDLNSFLKEDALAYQEKALVNTYVCFHKNAPVGFYSVCSDAIKLDESEKLQAFGSKKPHRDYPAVKIARLGVAMGGQNRGVGTFMVKLAIGQAISVSKEIGCRFVTVDAYPKDKVLAFYSKLGFTKNSADKSGSNVSMRLDLISFLRERK